MNGTWVVFTHIRDNDESFVDHLDIAFANCFIGIVNLTDKTLSLFHISLSFYFLP